MSDPSILDELAELCRQAGRILFVTGAGMSADSGLPTYRGIGGLYHERHTDDGVPIEVALSGAMLRKQPELTWKYLAEIEAACRGAKPNAGHRAIAALEGLGPSVTVLTQNVDGLHRAAGSREVIEIHGSLHRLVCTECGRGRPVEDYRGMQLPPGCPTCGGLVRPDVVLFGEELPMPALLRLEHALEAGFDLVFSVGTTSVFPYIAAPVHWARRAGVPTVEINPGESSVSGIVDFRIRARAAEVLPALLERCAG
ncbi:NAD-dependent deacylase [Cognatazoarcus halotolerans]|uniref:NAD-dependent deacylase n=1 Tax=Cognatazoarcus halotolerans TaxID=2686016 RepID=UPI00135B2E48|nr:NAD-dependent deacylase [Cognatazoarcus halotolerans]MCB1897896.1 NAD-dependent deacylase [Rhodocyclaceae bacterium]MCP5310590.1 NAD-dependent deacylase [Zoogloeaceae bacterium]